MWQSKQLGSRIGPRLYRADSPHGESGAITAELAVGFPAVVLLLIVILTLAAASSAQARALDAARAGARAVAIGQSQYQVGQAISRVSSTTARWELYREGQWARVEVWQPVAGGPFARVPLRAHGRAYAWLEPKASS